MKNIIPFLLLFFAVSSYSQFKITGFFDTKIGVNYQFSDRFETELRIHDDTQSEFNTSLSFLYKFVSKEKFNFNIGIGVSSYPFHSKNNHFESIFIPLNTEITPFNKIKNMALFIETAYHKADNNNNSGVRNSVGIRYIFD